MKKVNSLFASAWDSSSCPVCLEKVWKSLTAPGSVASTLRTCPDCMPVSAFLVRRIGSGQFRPRASSSRSKSIKHYAAWRSRPREALALRVAHLERVLRAQVLEARVDHRQLVEIAVASGARELQLLDRRRQAALQSVELGLRLVLQQPLDERRVGLRLQLVEPVIARMEAQRLGEQRERLRVAPDVLQSGGIRVEHRVRIRIARAGLG